METLHESNATDGMKCKVPYEYKGQQADSALIVSRVTLIGLLVFNSFNMYCVWQEILICLYWTYLIRLKQEGIVCFNKKWSRYYGRGLHRYHGSTWVYTSKTGNMGNTGNRSRNEVLNYHAGQRHGSKQGLVVNTLTLSCGKCHEFNFPPCVLTWGWVRNFISVKKVWVDLEWWRIILKHEITS